jgi:biofilm PGA synthesis N-glycosyltransferase PgaC
MMIFLPIFLLLMLAYMIIIGYYHQQWQAIPETFTHGGAEIVVSGIYSSTKRIDREQGTRACSVSVIVPTRNEAVNIERLIQGLIRQHFTPVLYEVIIVDDHSEDNTVALASEVANSTLRMLQLPPQLSGKKAAISYGIENAKGEIIITTDADCCHKPLWVYTITEAFRNSVAKMIVAPVQMVSSNTVLGIFQRLDFLVLQGITGASVFSKLHTMCNGANLAYEKSAFLEVNGFEGVDHIPSGDDLLLMEKISRRFPNMITYLKNKAAIVTTPTEPGWKTFLNQRVRWASKATHYKDRRLFLILLTTYLVNIGIVALGLLCIVYPFYTWIFVLFFIMKILAEYPLVISACSFFGEKLLVYLFPLFQPLHVIYTLFAGWLGTFGSYTWKSRVIKNKGTAKLLKQ